MKAIKCDLPMEHKEIAILPLADIHLGDPHSDYKRIQELLAYVRDTDNAYCVLNGDLMDAAITSSIGDTYGASLQPMEQLRECVKLFEPLKDKILAVMPGNHEYRVYRTDGIDLTEIMCSQLGIVDRYSPASAILFIRFGKDPKHGRKLCYTVFCTHGSGGGRGEGAKIKRCADLANIIDADVYLHSHSHLPAVFKTGFFRADPNNSSFARVDKLFVNTAAMLEYGGYGEMQNYKPASLDTPLVRLDGRKKRATAAL